MDLSWRRPDDAPDRWPRFRPQPLDLRATRSAAVACLEDLVEAYETGRTSLNNVEVAHHPTEVCLAVAPTYRQGGRWIDLPDRDLYVLYV